MRGEVTLEHHVQVAEIAHADLDLLVARLEELDSGVAVAGGSVCVEICRGLGADVLEALRSASQLLTVSSKPSISLDVVLVGDAGDVAQHVARQPDALDAHLEPRHVEHAMAWSRPSSCPRVTASCRHPQSSRRKREKRRPRRAGADPRCALASAIARHSPGCGSGGRQWPPACRRARRTWTLRLVRRVQIELIRAARQRLVLAQLEDGVARSGTPSGLNSVNFCLTLSTTQWNSLRRWFPAWSDSEPPGKPRVPQEGRRPAARARRLDLHESVELVGLRRDA